MPTTFDDAVMDLVATAEGFGGFEGVERACAVRDLRGRVRLVVQGGEALDLAALNEALNARLRGWFFGPVLSTPAGKPAEARLAREVLSRAQPWPVQWPSAFVGLAGGETPIDTERWRGVQRLLSKQAWLDGTPATPLWALERGAPAVVAFYSFKGGVGRSTLVGIMAWQLARLGKRVVVVDLDVEAPGLGSLFNVQGGPSVLDYLLTHAATDQLPQEDPVQDVTVHGVTVGVVSAGMLGRGYIEKLARLDYLAVADAQSPVEKALRMLLTRIRGQHQPDYIFLDCRAGIHDLGGLSLNDLAHVDVLVGRDSPQGRDGLALTLEVLAARRAPIDQRVLLVQTFVPLPLTDEASQWSQARYRAAMYAACQRTLYAGLDDAPAENDNQAAHYPWPVAQRDELAAYQQLADISEGTLLGQELLQLRARLQALAADEGHDDEGHEDE